MDNISGKLLLVDDNDLSRGAFKLSLEREGFLVEAAAGGAEALTLLAGRISDSASGVGRAPSAGGSGSAALRPQVPAAPTPADAGRTFDLILLDIQMPGMNGYEILAHVRNIHSAADLPVIMVTARDRSEDIVQALESGANDYLTKPINFPVALARIHTQLQNRQAVHILRESEARLRQIEEMKNDFISMVSHELTTPITVIDGAINSFKDKLFGPFNEKYESYVDMIAQNVAQLARLAYDLNDLSKMVSGLFSIERRPVDLSRVILNATDALRDTAGRRGIAIEFSPSSMPHSHAIVDADPQRIEQVVSNIVRNALRFANSRVDISIDVTETVCRIIVQDDGPGIDPADLPKIFDKFYRGKKGNDAMSGHGLGLAIVKGIVEGHGGTVVAKNVLSAAGSPLGARFTVTLNK